MLYVAPSDDRAMGAGIAGLIDDSALRRKTSEFGQIRLRNTVAFKYSVPNLLAACDAARALIRPSIFRRRLRPRPNALVYLANLYTVAPSAADCWRRTGIVDTFAEPPRAGDRARQRA